MPATTQKKTAKQPQDHKPKTKGGFGKRRLIPITLPSGSEIMVIRPGVQGLVKAGILDSFDQLTAIVSGEVIPRAEGAPAPKIDAKTLVQDPEKLKQATEMMDKIVMFIVQEPKVISPIKLGDDGKPVLDADGKPVELTDEERDPDAAYIDYVEDEDKAYIMNFALGGSSDLQRFREESEAALAGVSDVKVPEQGAL